MVDNTPVDTAMVVVHPSALSIISAGYEDSMWPTVRCSNLFGGMAKLFYCIVLVKFRDKFDQIKVLELNL